MLCFARGPISFGEVPDGGYVLNVILLMINSVFGFIVVY